MTNDDWLLIGTGIAIGLFFGVAYTHYMFSKINRGSDGKNDIE